jgi:hypothetical protein
MKINTIIVLLLIAVIKIGFTQGFGVAEFGDDSYGYQINQADLEAVDVYQLPFVIGVVNSVIHDNVFDNIYVKAGEIEHLLLYDKSFGGLTEGEIYIIRYLPKSKVITYVNRLDKKFFISNITE